MVDIQVAACSGSGNVCLGPQAAICQSQTVRQALHRGDCILSIPFIYKKERTSCAGSGQKGKRDNPALKKHKTCQNRIIFVELVS